MAQTKKRRRRKHRGTQGGRSTPARRAAAPAQPRRRRKSARPLQQARGGAGSRVDEPPTWRSARQSAASIAAAIFAVLLVVLFKQPARARPRPRRPACSPSTSRSATTSTSSCGAAASGARSRRASGRTAGEPMDVRMLTVGPVQRTASSPAATAPTAALVVDPGDEAERILAAIEELGIDGRRDPPHPHATSTTSARSRRSRGRPARRSTAPRSRCRCSPTSWPSSRGPGFGPFESYEADQTVAGGEKLELAGLEIDVIFTPGHSPGHVTYSIPRRGGALLRRRPLPGLGRPHRPAGRRLGDAARVDPRPGRRASRRRRRVYPGHMGITTLGAERATNPFLAELAR